MDYLKPLNKDEFANSVGVLRFLATNWAKNTAFLHMAVFLA